jgi:hypothetical protein
MRPCILVGSYQVLCENLQCYRIFIQMGLIQELSSFEFPLTVYQTALCSSLEK